MLADEPRGRIFRNVREGLLRVGVDCDGWAMCSIFGGDGERRGDSGLAAASLLGSDYDRLHWSPRLAGLAGIRDFAL